MPRIKASKGEGRFQDEGDSLSWAEENGLVPRAREGAVRSDALADSAPPTGELRVHPTPQPTADGRDLGADEPYMIGCSLAMRVAFDLVRRFAITNAPVLVTGESGTGKELAALAIHERSEYRSGPFVPINCAGLPPTLIDSELFGYEKGAFTGATKRKIGRLEAANGGTVFLDEIGDLPLELQAHLLRFLQEGMVQRLGGNRTIPVTARIIAATNKDLATEIEAGRFREDLFYRLNTLVLELPPLRIRDDDLYLISTFFLKKFAAEMGRPVDGFDDSAIRAMRDHEWPGNVRELISRVRRAVVMVDEGRIGAADLDLDVSGGPVSGATADPDTAPYVPGFAIDFEDELPTLEAARSLVEKTLVQRALRLHSGNISKAAGKLGISRVTLYRLLEKYNLKSH